MTKEWRIIEKRIAYDGYFQIEKYRLQHTLYEGGWGPVIERELFERGHVGGVLPYDAKRDQVLLIEQFRVGAIKDCATPWLLELIAGVVEKGENAADMLRREAQEEAGIQLGELLPICNYLVSPGCSTEHLSLYCAHADLSNAGGIHGLAVEGENILVKVMSTDEALALLEQGCVNNAMTLIALQWLALHRHRL